MGKLVRGRKGLKKMEKSLKVLKDLEKSTKEFREKSKSINGHKIMRKVPSIKTNL